MVAYAGGRALLKEKSWLLHPDEFDAHLAVQQHAHHASPAQAPAVVRTLDGQLSVAVEARRFALHEWVEPAGTRAPDGPALFRGLDHNIDFVRPLLLSLSLLFFSRFEFTPANIISF